MVLRVLRQRYPDLRADFVQGCEHAIEFRQAAYLIGGIAFLLLSRRWRAYYHWLQGVALVIDGRIVPARDHLLQARRWRFRTENDRSIMECQLADMAIRCGEPAQAWGHLRHARGLRHHPLVDALIAQVERQIPADVR